MQLCVIVLGICVLVLVPRAPLPHCTNDCGEGFVEFCELIFHMRCHLAWWYFVWWDSEVAVPVTKPRVTIIRSARSTF